ncbi:Tannase and feruloyl esterase [Micromonospora chokoriensis]|uniref:Tannase and feruloyl esterase n=1 Tax=Micromonospora chokoriensis TaxID=356851 RepID=A0A1C4YRL3_9ACTN|nr:Tannase and feruloyl esterase [Micromonospora chokoriensis]
MKRRLMILMAAAVPLAASLTPVAVNAATRDGGTTAATTCAAVPVSAPPGTAVVSVKAVAKAGGDFTFPSTPGLPQNPPINAVPAWCDINVVVTHPGANDTVTIKVSLPQDARNWNGRFQATGGSAYSAGDLSDLSVPLISAVKGGYVGAATDAGVKTGLDASWGLTPDGEINTGLLTNFASRSVHDMAVIGKDVANKFYHRTVRYSYFTGCSTGGRQGYAEAQNYPTDFQGILANAPAIEWNRFEIATLWSQAVYNEEKVAPSQCELAAFNTAAVAACDTLDGVKDGVIDNPQDCTWDARRLVGTRVVCEGKEITITKAVADAVNKIWAGPVSPSGKKLWYGQNKGSAFNYIANPGAPFQVPDQWAKYFVTKNPSFDSTKLTYQTFTQLFTSATKQYDSIIANNNPNLSRFAKAGGKLLTWHGQSDQLIPTQGTVDYRKHVNATLGGNKRVNNFYRVFLLPGVDHCGTPLFSTGPLVNPGADLDALVNWVEKGHAPATLPVTSVDGKTTSNIHHYPR